MLKIPQKKAVSPGKKFEPPGIQADQRKEDRIILHAPLIFGPFSTRFHREFASMTFNHSKGGMCLEATEPFKPGYVLYIRLDNAPTDQSYYGDRKYLRSTTLGEVKWCREFQDNFSTYYRIGIQYY